MKSQSVWKNGFKQYPSQTGDIERETVVVGGGIAGILTAYLLAEAGENVTLIEADRLCSGTTGRTTAKITWNQGSVYAELYGRYGQEAAALYYRSQVQAMNDFSDLVKKYRIDCDFEKTDGYIFTTSSDALLKRTYRVLKSAGADCEWCEGAPPFAATCALKAKGQYIFDPLKFLSALPVRYEIFEQTRATDIDAPTKTITTDTGKIKAERIIVATHYPIINAHGGYYFKLRQSTSYTLAFGQKVADAMYLDEKEDGVSVRPYADGTILGGGDHRTGRSETTGHYRSLEREAEKLFGIDGATHGWFAQDVMTFDKLPMAGLYAEGLKDVFVITGFNKWGMTNAMACASLIADTVRGKANDFAALFSPQRKIKGSFGDFVSNAMTNFKEIFLGYFRITSKTVYEIPPDSGKVVSFQGKKRAVYRDKKNHLYVIGSMCPHMHGELKWNGDTKTWDCPCHGSRFDIYGNTVSEPSTKCCKFDEGEI